MDLKNFPSELSTLSVYIKCANEHEKLDPVITYYSLMYFIQNGIGLKTRNPDVKKYLNAVMDNLEKLKLTYKDREEINSETVGIAYVEQYALNKFNIAYQKDLNCDFHQNTIKLFLLASTLLDVVSAFSEIDQETENIRKYSKWKAVYIHKCLKNGETPRPGPADDNEFNMPFSVDQNKPSNNLNPSSPAQFSSSTSNNVNIRDSFVEETKEDANTDDGISIEQWLNIEKFIKFASSAVQHQDTKTIIQYLKSALAILESRK